MPIRNRAILTTCTLAAIAVFAAAIAGHNPAPPPALAGHSLEAKPRLTMTSEADELLGRGRRLYDICATCHMPDGSGVSGINPPLFGAHVSEAPPGRLIRALIHGVTGPLTVDGTEYDAAMPTAPLETDADIAAVLTYVRQAFGNNASAVSTAMVTAVRAQTKDREDPWTTEELDQIR
ncbi:Cytochrome c-552 [Phycisphaerales bacterium]|nr:Cytochrome c-552 [Phycisphaerales bacterium]